MNPKKVESQWNQTKGQFKEDVGHAIGSNKMENEGIADQIKGKVQHGITEAKDSIKRGVDHLLHRDEKPV